MKKVTLQGFREWLILEHDYAEEKEKSVLERVFKKFSQVLKTYEVGNGCSIKEATDKQ